MNLKLYRIGLLNSKGYENDETLIFAESEEEALKIADKMWYVVTNNSHQIEELEIKKGVLMTADVSGYNCSIDYSF